MTMHEFMLPDLGEGLAEAEIRNWLVDLGDVVGEGQPLVEVETAKALVEISAPVTGAVTAFGGAPGDLLPVGALLAVFACGPLQSAKDPPAGAGRTPLAYEAEPESRQGVHVDPVADVMTAPQMSDGPISGQPIASPSTRKYASTLGIDLTRVVPSGPGGRVTRDDVTRAADSSAGSGQMLAGASNPVKVTDQVIPLRGIRREVARSMSNSWQNIPHVTEFREVSARALIDARTALADRTPADAPTRLGYLPFMVLACARALRRHPALNSSIDVDHEVITHWATINIGIATSGDDGLVVPVLRDVDQLSLQQVSDRTTELVARARARTARAEDFSGGTFTISNFGSYGTWLGTPLILPPQAAIAGFGRIHDAVVAVNGRPVVRATLPVAVSADHRIVDGHVLGMFMSDVAEFLENPILLFSQAP